MLKLKMLKPTIKAADTRQIRMVNPDSWRNDKTSSAQRGYGYKWQQARAKFLAEHPLCRYCLERDNIVTPATVVDHIVPHRGDSKLFWRRSNWQSLCARHHSSDKQREENGAR
ncbi:HNH endonuclease signature motif containing protein [Oceanisphaera sediminis]|uniref:Putative HNH nuclease YajD n=1 Tax=Oceanisphaera sediminis TaxID=981381 RepID=A0ABP7ENH6_9GAMM